MIPRAGITAWRKTAPWPNDSHVEQDLVVSRALVELFNRPIVGDQVAFRGGTALHKLFFNPPGRYSEDIDLVQQNAGPIGPLTDEIRRILDPWLGQPKWKAGRGRFTFYYRFDTTTMPLVRMRVKLEINTREHFAVHGWTRRTFTVRNSWFSGSAAVTTYELPELLGTKLRALYQRKKGRDLFDLALGLEHPEFNVDALLAAFVRYMEFGGAHVTRAQFESNVTEKMADAALIGDVPSLLRSGLTYEPAEAWDRVHDAIIAKLPGQPWKEEGETRGEGRRSGWTAIRVMVPRGRHRACEFVSGVACVKLPRGQPSYELALRS